MWQPGLIFLFKILPEKGKELLFPMQEKNQKKNQHNNKYLQLIRFFLVYLPFYIGT